MNMLLGGTESDGFAIAMIAILGLSFTFVFVILFGIIRHARKHAKEQADLPEVENEAQPAGPPNKKEEKEPWEKDADWWKKDS